MLKRIRAGEPFDTGRSVPAPAPYTFSGGDLGWRKVEDLPSLFTDIVPKLAPGQTADPVRSDNGFHLVFLEAVRGEDQMVSQTKARHILVKPSEIMTDDQARDLVAALKARALAGEDFARPGQRVLRRISAPPRKAVNWAGPFPGKWCRNSRPPWPAPPWTRYPIRCGHSSAGIS